MIWNVKHISVAGLEEATHVNNIRKGLIVPIATGRRSIDDFMLQGLNVSDIVTVGGACLAGDTMIKIRRGNRNGGRASTIKNLYEQINGLYKRGGKNTANPWDLRVPTYTGCYAHDLERNSYIKINKLIYV